MNYADYHTLTINGQTLSGSEIIRFCEDSREIHLQQLGIFVSEWLHPASVLEINTSGSTGTPKTIFVEKNKFLQSAAMTARYFHFQTGDTALLCLPVSYIAGKMMVVRSFFSGLNLVCIPPSGKPMEELPEGISIDFAPLTPMQLSGETSAPGIKKILLGGGPVDPVLEGRLQPFASQIYHGYGMTETLSHIAVRRVNGADRSDIYEALEGVSFDTDENDCLIISVPFLDEDVYTTDVVELISDTSFIWRGRADFVINSGGLKFYPEELEKAIHFISQRFFFAGMPDERFGEKICLFVEGIPLDKQEVIDLRQNLEKVIDKYALPKEIYFVPSFKQTSSGKVNRLATVQMISENLEP